jgi:hypothetical protein
MCWLARDSTCTEQRADEVTQQKGEAEQGEDEAVQQAGRLYNRQVSYGPTTRVCRNIRFEANISKYDANIYSLRSE